MAIKEQVSAGKKLGAADARRLAKNATKIVVMKGKKVTTFDLVRDKTGDSELMAHMLGSTGNLRAPLIVRGKTLLVGFNADVYAEVLG